MRRQRGAPGWRTQQTCRGRSTNDVTPPVWRQEGGPQENPATNAGRGRTTYGSVQDTVSGWLLCLPGTRAVTRQALGSGRLPSAMARNAPLRSPASSRLPHGRAHPEGLECHYGVRDCRAHAIRGGVGRILTLAVAKLPKAGVSLIALHGDHGPRHRLPPSSIDQPLRFGRSIHLLEDRKYVGGSARLTRRRQD